MVGIACTYTINLCFLSFRVASSPGYDMIPTLKLSDPGVQGNFRPKSGNMSHIWDPPYHWLLKHVPFLVAWSSLKEVYGLFRLFRKGRSLYTHISISYFSVPQHSQSLTAVPGYLLLLFKSIQRLFLAYLTELTQHSSQRENSLYGIYFVCGETWAAQLSSE